MAKHTGAKNAGSDSEKGRDLNWTIRTTCKQCGLQWFVSAAHIYLDAEPGQAELIYIVECPDCGDKIRIPKQIIPGSVIDYLLGIV